jgi:hypothetical protein
MDYIFLWTAVEAARMKDCIKATLWSYIEGSIINVVASEF